LATLGIFGELLISGVAYEYGEGGARTTLTLVRPDAFRPPPDREVPEANLGFGPPLESASGPGAAPLTGPAPLNASLITE